jgi:periplasmic divalent cation tolerance protein
MHIVIFVTCAKKKEAGLIARSLVRERLAACVNIIKGIESFFWWQGKADRAQELLLIIKSKKEKLPKIIKLLKSLHSYQVPEIIALPVVGGFRPYLRWIDESVRKSS